MWNDDAHLSSLLSIFGGRRGKNIIVIESGRSKINLIREG